LDDKEGRKFGEAKCFYCSTVWVAVHEEFVGIWSEECTSVSRVTRDDEVDSHGST
jgi:hypothetical protein